jgi:hypothetical protein
MLIENTLFGIRNKVEISLTREPVPKPLNE